MEWVITIECRLSGQVLHRTDLATITRQDTPLCPEHVGLTLRDSKTVLNVIQRTVVTDQVDVEAAAWATCPHCQRRKRTMGEAMPPEYMYLLAKWGSRMPYRRAAA
jgi:hypothetical protein